MISYSLHCPENHRFDSWFQSAAAYEALVLARRLSCPVCGSVQVEKALMAPAVRPARSKAGTASVAGQPQAAGDVPTASALRTPANEREAALAALRREVEETSDYVGLNFVTEARAMHDGDAPARAIYGEAHIEDARKLIEDGVPVAPLPFMPRHKVN